MIALLDRGHAGADVDDDTSAFMTEDRREETFGVRTGQREIVGVADAGRLDLDQHLAGPRAFELNGHHFQRLAGLNGDGGAYIHLFSP
ncbi:hypothetical protein D3C87_1798680 [compost metagenome]